MNILFDIAHPAHVHLLRFTYFNLLSDGHKVIVTVKNIPSAIELLKLYNIPYIYLGDKKDSLLLKALGQFLYNLRVWSIVRKHKISIGVGSSITVAHVSRLSKMMSIVLDDDDDAVEPLFAKYAHPYCNVILSPDCVTRKARQTIGYAGFHELAYLHPNKFVPDEKVLEIAGVRKGEKFFVLRFNAFKAHHDVGVQGLSIENKRRLIAMLERYGKVFITTERNIDEEFRKYQLKVSPEKIHSLIYYATMLIGDSQTMTSEAAVLVTPSIRSNTFVGRISYLEEEEHRYGLTFGFLPLQSDAMFDKIEKLLAMPNLKEEFLSRRQKLLADKIDVSAFFTWFIENYPESADMMRDDSDCQYKFR